MLSHGLSFAVLREGPLPIATRHYDVEYWSDSWLLDRWGNRVGDRPIQFSASRFERLLDDLYESGS